VDFKENDMGNELPIGTMKGGRESHRTINVFELMPSLAEGVVGGLSMGGTLRPQMNHVTVSREGRSGQRYKSEGCTVW